MGKQAVFADDTILFYSHKNIDTLNKTVNQELKKIARWLCANKLTLNIKKTHFIIFKSKKRKLNQTVSIKINEQPIELVKYTKFLGVYIDEELSWKHHIDQVVSKISQMTGIMAKVRHYLSLKTNSRQFITLWYIRTWRTAISFWTLVLIQPGWNHYSGFRKKLLESWPLQNIIRNLDHYSYNLNCLTYIN